MKKQQQSSGRAASVKVIDGADLLAVRGGTETRGDDLKQGSYTTRTNK